MFWSCPAPWRASLLSTFDPIYLDYAVVEIRYTFVKQPPANLFCYPLPLCPWLRTRDPRGPTRPDLSPVLTRARAVTRPTPGFQRVIGCQPSLWVWSLWSALGVALGRQNRRPCHWTRSMTWPSRNWATGWWPSRSPVLAPPVLRSDTVARPRPAPPLLGTPRSEHEPSAYRPFPVDPSSAAVLIECFSVASVRVGREIGWWYVESGGWLVHRIREHFVHGL